MLSRVAERMYWFGRYCERIENTARLVSVYSSLTLDMPALVKHIWGDLVEITGSTALFNEKFKEGNERNVTRFMLTDRSNPGSLICSINSARENARTAREILPAEAWEQINGLYHYVRTHGDDALKRNSRHQFLADVIRFCYQMTGLFFGNMSHGNAYSFIFMGRNLERADMATRIVDVGCINLLQEQANIPDTYDNVLWMNVLRSLGAYQMFRQHVKERVNGEDVVEFLIKDMNFPRSVNHCLGEIEHCFARLPAHELPLREVRQTERMVNRINTAALMQSGLHEFIDEIQVRFAGIHTSIGKAWFGYGKS